MQALTRTAIRPARRVLARAAPGVAPPQQFAMVTRNVSKGPSAMGGIYNLAMSSTSRYVTAVVAAAAVFELAFGFVTDTFWESHNKGVSAVPPQTCLCQILSLTTLLCPIFVCLQKLFHHVDWSKFKSSDDDDEDDDDEDDDE